MNEKSLKASFYYTHSYGHTRAHYLVGSRAYHQVHLIYLTCIVLFHVINILNIIILVNDIS